MALQSIAYESMSKGRSTIARRLDDMGILGTLKMIGYVALSRGTCRNERLVGPHSEKCQQRYPDNDNHDSSNTAHRLAL